MPRAGTMRLPLSLAAPLAIAACASPAIERRGGAFFPDEARLVDFTRPSSGAAGERRTTLLAPALLPTGGDTVDRIEPGRCVAPLAVIDLRERALLAGSFRFGAEDLAEHEARHGEIERGSVVVLLCGGGRRAVDAAGSPFLEHPGLAPGVVELLLRQRGAIGFGTDAPALDPSADGGDAARDAALAAGAYVLVDLATLPAVPPGRSLLLMAPPLEPRPSAPIRVLALVPRTIGHVSR